MIEVRFVDIHGRLKAMNLPLDKPAATIEDVKTDSIFETGANIDGSSVEGFTPIENSDLNLIPLPETLFQIPYTELPKVASMCEIQRNGKVSDVDTRSRLRQQMEILLGENQSLNIGPEPEFFIIQDNKPVDSGGYGEIFPSASASGLIKRFSDDLIKAGIVPHVHHHETAPGQYEIELAHHDALITSDTVVNYKGLIRALAVKSGLRATFMPKPFEKINGNGMHFHISLWEGTTNLFATENPNELSELGYQFIAGLLEHARGLTAIVAPTVNSYKRLVPGYEAPVYIAWAPLNRSALIRIPMFTKPAHARLEYRCPDPSSNIYLAILATMAAGIDGIKNNLELAPPIKRNIYKMNTEERIQNNIGSLPGNLHESLGCFKQDKVLQDALGSFISQQFIKQKEREWLDYSIQVTDWDWDKYFNV